MWTEVAIAEWRQAAVSRDNVEQPVLGLIDRSHGGDRCLYFRLRDFQINDGFDVARLSRIGQLLCSPRLPVEALAKTSVQGRDCRETHFLFLMFLSYSSVRDSS